jgi:integration host factor subunit alpha
MSEKVLANRTVTRADLRDLIKESFGLSGVDSQDVVERVIREIITILKEGETLKVPLFGVFFTHHKRERMGRNPKTCKPAIISERRVVRFHVSRLMKRRINLVLKQKLGIEFNS